MGIISNNILITLVCSRDCWPNHNLMLNFLSASCCLGCWIRP